MQFSDPGLNHAFDPLKVVDIKTLAAVAENFKKSKDKSKRAIGVFLDRINRLRTEEPRDQAKQQAPTTASNILRSTGLQDLRE
jgi:hypothetical protein